jgi:hypothetical protein
LVKDHYANLGFSLVDTAPDGTTRWELDVHTARVVGAPMIVHSLGFELPGTA